MYSIYLPVIQSMNMTTKYSDLTQLNPYLHEPFSRKSLVDALDLGAQKSTGFSRFLINLFLQDLLGSGIIQN